MAAVGQSQTGRAWRLPPAAGSLESVRIALESLRANKLRTLLTMLGIIIGVWSVVSLLALGTGARQRLTGELEALGTNLLSVEPGAPRRTGVFGMGRTLTLDDAAAIERAIPEIVTVAPSYQGTGQIVANGVNRAGGVVGVTPEYAGIRNLTVARGQFITESMNRSARPVVVLGGDLAEDLFGADDPIGASIRINSQPFRVVGVLEAGDAFGITDNLSLVPLNTAYQTLFGGRTATSTSRQVSSISMQARSPDDLSLAQLKVEQLMRRRHDLPEDGEGDDFTVQNQATLLQSLGTLTTTLTVMLGAIAGISLLVGGIGVMNIMLVSVTERTREIGLRKAVGAKRRDILRQFLVEALVVSIIGGIIGLGLAIATATAIGTFFGEYLVPRVTIGSVVLALSFSAAVGLFFGIYPARRAARLNPIQALRYE